MHYDWVSPSHAFVLYKLLIPRPYPPQLELAPFPTQRQVHNLAASTTVPCTEPTFRLPVPGYQQLEQAQSPRLNHPHTYTYLDSTNLESLTRLFERLYTIGPGISVQKLYMTSPIPLPSIL